jgi:hypothetical protein
MWNDVVERKKKNQFQKKATTFAQLWLFIFCMRAILFVLTPSLHVMNSSRYRLFTIITIVVIAFAVLFFFLLKPAKAPVDEGGAGVLPENPPTGVSVETLENGERLVKNAEDGYEVKVAADMYLYKNSSEQDLVVQSFLEPDVAYGGNPGCKVTVSVAEGELGDYGTGHK